MEEALEPLTEKQREFERVIELAEVQKHMSPYRWQGIGRKREDRLEIVRAFVAKAVYNFPNLMFGLIAITATQLFRLLE
jgi:hypothetical protein